MKSPYLTIINHKQKYNPKDFVDFEFETVKVRFGDWGKRTSYVEKQTIAAYREAVKQLEQIGAVCTLNSAGRSNFDQLYVRIETLARNILGNVKAKIKNKKHKHITAAHIGHSEHAAGFALDGEIKMDNAIIPEKIKQRFPHYNDEDLRYETSRIIMEKHGFILRYAKDERLKDVAGVKEVEKWHWRYVSPEHSQQIARIRTRVNAIIFENAQTKQDLTEIKEGYSTPQAKRYEVFLEDYTKLLQYKTHLKGDELIDFYAKKFIENIPELKITFNEDLNF